METKDREVIPDYLLKKGVSIQRAGVILLEKEKVFELLDERSFTQKESFKNDKEIIDYIENKINENSNKDFIDRKEEIDINKKIKLLEKKLEFIEKLYWWNST